MNQSNNVNYENIDKASYLSLEDIKAYYIAGYISEQEMQQYISATVAHIKRTIEMHKAYQNDHAPQFESDNKALPSNVLS